MQYLHALQYAVEDFGLPGRELFEGSFEHGAFKKYSGRAGRSLNCHNNLYRMFVNFFVSLSLWLVSKMNRYLHMVHKILKKIRKIVRYISHERAVPRAHYRLSCVHLYGDYAGCLRGPAQDSQSTAPGCARHSPACREVPQGMVSKQDRSGVV